MPWLNTIKWRLSAIDSRLWSNTLKTCFILCFATLTEQWRSSLADRARRVNTAFPCHDIVCPLRCGLPCYASKSPHHLFSLPLTRPWCMSSIHANREWTRITSNYSIKKMKNAFKLYVCIFMSTESLSKLFQKYWKKIKILTCKNNRTDLPSRSHCMLNKTNTERCVSRKDVWYIGRAETWTKIVISCDQIIMTN